MNPDDGGQPDSKAVARNASVLEPIAPEASAVFRALGHEGRLLILGHLCDGEKSVSELRERLPFSEQVVSAQLARLRYEGIVTSKRDGKRSIYSVPQGLARTVVEGLGDAVGS